MDIREERVRWKHDSANVNAFVDVMVQKLKEVDAHPAAYMCIDIVFRSYLQWLHSAQISKVDPELARNSTIHLMSIILIELASRMNAIDEDGNKMPIDEWVRDFVTDLGTEIGHDLISLTNRKLNG